jgi:hypothetical protein
MPRSRQKRKLDMSQHPGSPLWSWRQKRLDLTSLPYSRQIRRQVRRRGAGVSTEIDPLIDTSTAVFATASTAVTQCTRGPLRRQLKPSAWGPAGLLTCERACRTDVIDTMLSA